MIKLIFLIVIVIIGYVAYTGINVDSEYGSASMLRNEFFENVFDPLAKMILSQASESNLDKIIEDVISKQGDV